MAQNITNFQKRVNLPSQPAQGRNRLANQIIPEESKVSKLTDQLSPEPLVTKLNQTTGGMISRRQPDPSTTEKNEIPSHAIQLGSQGQGRQRRTTYQESRNTSDSMEEPHQLFIKQDDVKHHSQTNQVTLCNKCGERTKQTNMPQPPRIGRKRPQVNNQSFTQSAMDRSEII